LRPTSKVLKSEKNSEAAAAAAAAAVVGEGWWK